MDFCRGLMFLLKIGCFGGLLVEGEVGFVQDCRNLGLRRVVGMSLVLEAFFEGYLKKFRIFFMIIE